MESVPSNPSTLDDFAKRLTALRAGESAAIDAFVQQYESYIRRTIRFRISSAALQPIVDSVDICQSVFGSFLLRLGAGQYEIESEEDLRKLLYTIAGRKFVSLRRHERSSKRDRSQTRSLNEISSLVDNQTDDPVNAASLRELQIKCYELLTDHEQTLLTLRQEGKSWDEIAAELHTDPIILRKRLSRAIDRIILDLGLETDDG
jgi:RNA polymerase sigma factor (sigma-70 family)